MQLSKKLGIHSSVCNGLCGANGRLTNCIRFENNLVADLNRLLLLPPEDNVFSRVRITGNRNWQRSFSRLTSSTEWKCEGNSNAVENISVWLNPEESVALWHIVEMGVQFVREEKVWGPNVLLGGEREGLVGWVGVNTVAQPGIVPLLSECELSLPLFGLATDVGNAADVSVHRDQSCVVTWWTKIFVVARKDLVHDTSLQLDPGCGTACQEEGCPE